MQALVYPLQFVSLSQIHSCVISEFIYLSVLGGNGMGGATKRLVVAVHGWSSVVFIPKHTFI